MSRGAKALRWAAGPVAIAALAAGVGHWRAARRPDAFRAAVAALPEADRRALESVPAMATANVTWAYGPEEAVRRTVRAELDRPDADGARRARVLVRLGIIDNANPEGQVALFSQACAIDPTTCDRRKEVAERETHARFVAPGNALPPFLVDGHPPVGAP